MKARLRRLGRLQAEKQQLRKYASRADAYRFYGYLRRSRVADREYETFSADEIFQRDRWICGLCGKKVQQDLRWPDKRSASLDHIQPIAEGGTHVRANVQCTHLGCNTRKGRGSGGQLRMFG
jgi:5-methylcytosine-specific restriction endonuclease McrA